MRAHTQTTNKFKQQANNIRHNNKQQRLPPQIPTTPKIHRQSLNPLYENKQAFMKDAYAEFKNKSNKNT